MENEEFLPCPFCHCTHRLSVYENKIQNEDHMLFGSLYSYVFCAICSTHGPASYNVGSEEESIQYAIANWNKRSKY